MGSQPSPACFQVLFKSLLLQTFAKFIYLLYQGIVDGTTFCTMWKKYYFWLYNKKKSCMVTCHKWIRLIGLKLYLYNNPFKYGNNNRQDMKTYWISQIVKKKKKNRWSVDRERIIDFRISSQPDRSKSLRLLLQKMYIVES